MVDNSPFDRDDKCQTNEFSSGTCRHYGTNPLSVEQIDEFVQNRVLVVPNVLSQNEMEEACYGLRETLHQSHGVDPDHLEETGHNLMALSSTHGSGGVMDLFYPRWKLHACTLNEKLFYMTTQLWQAA